MNIEQVRKSWSDITRKIEPFWSLVGAPIVEELIFRFIPYQFYLASGEFYIIGIASSMLFAAIHWRFGKWFTLYAFVGGFVAWLVIVNFGLLWAIVLHVFANFVLLQLGILQKIKSR